jgi:hypothetical protein
MTYNTGLSAFISFYTSCDKEEILIERKVTSVIDCLSNVGGLFGLFMIGAKLFAVFHEESLLK